MDYPHTEIIALILGGLDFLVEAVHINHPEWDGEQAASYIIKFIEDTFPMLEEWEVTKILNIFADMQEELIK